ncbi:UDP-N-acetylmuramoyl-tripeptide--D-alanyl-D-alanine ligase [Moritella viscosa]
MISLALSAIATQLNAKYQGDDVVITHVSTDTRTIKVGDLFVALSGDNFDANSFVAKAAEQGAIAAIVTKKQAVDIPQIQVKDSRVALGLLGKMVREHVNPKVAALTGSNGKTTTKEMLAAILKQVAPTLATAGNFNNDIGVPLTLLRLQQEDQFAVMELGANHKKEIAYTTGLVLPDVVLINNVDAAHLEGFGDLQGIALAKSEILSGVKEQGMAVLNRDDKFYQYWLRKVDSQRHVNFSVVDESADYFAANIEFADSGNPTFRLCTPDSDCSINCCIMSLMH